MCQHKTLYHKDNIGYVVQCVTCNKIQVAFNVMAITFDEVGFEQFRKNIEKTFCERQPGINPQVKCILIPSPCEGMNLLLSVSELELLHTILEEADNEMKALSMIQQLQEG